MVSANTKGPAIDHEARGGAGEHVLAQSANPPCQGAARPDDRRYRRVSCRTAVARVHHRAFARSVQGSVRIQSSWHRRVRGRTALAALPSREADCSVQGSSRCALMNDQ